MPKSIYLIDGGYQISRAYHSPMFVELTSITGEPTKAIFIFLRMFFSMLERHRPDYVAIFFDCQRHNNFRRQIDPRYKANRDEKLPWEGFSSQVERTKQILKAMGAAVIEAPNYEADDLIATACFHRRFLDFRKVIISRDKDLMRLLDMPDVQMFDPLDELWINEGLVIKKLGVPPKLVSEFLAVFGDEQDGIPGFDGIGDKGAAKLVLEQGGLDNLIANLPEITKKSKFKSLTKERLELNFKLATLKKDCRFPINIEDWETKKIQMAGARAIFQELGMNSFLRETVDEIRAKSAGAGRRSGQYFRGSGEGVYDDQSRVRRGMANDQNPRAGKLDSSTRQYRTGFR